MLLCFLVTLVGPRAMIGYKPRQARKGATVVADSCAVVWLTRAASIQNAIDTDLVEQAIYTLKFFDEEFQ